MHTITVEQLIEKLQQIENKKAPIFGYLNRGDDGIGNLPITSVECLSSDVAIIFESLENID